MAQFIGENNNFSIVLYEMQKRIRAVMIDKEIMKIPLFSLTEIL